MLSTLELRNFRGLEHVKFENLGVANLIVGGNNVGKTSLLEALVLLHGSREQLQELPVTFRRLPKKGSDPIPTFWKLLFRGDPEECGISDDQVSITGRKKGDVWQLSSQGGTLLSFATNGKISIKSGAKPIPLAILSTEQDDPSEVSEMFNLIAPLNPENENRLEDLLRRSIEPRLRRLRYARPQGTNAHMVYADLGEGSMLPFTQLGQAFSRALQIYCEIFSAKPKILLVDEIENGLYHEGLQDYWRGLLEVLVEQEVQLFATTHSRECMEAAHKAASARVDYPLRFLRLDRRIDSPLKIAATTFAKEEMQTAVESELEMR